MSELDLGFANTAMRLDGIIAILLTIANACWSHVSAHECSSSESVACRKEFENLREHKKKYQYATDNQTLSEMCRKQFLALKCVNAFAEECLPEEEQEVFRTLTNGSDAFFDYFCLEDSELRKRYLKHSSCIRSISSQLDVCTKEYETSQKKLDDSEDDYVILRQRTCCLYFENIRCSSNATAVKCGEPASLLVADLWRLLGGTYLNELCHPYEDYSPDTCTPVPSSSASTILGSIRLWLFPFCYGAAYVFTR